MEKRRMKYVDLHIHSKYSDGELSPIDIIKYAKQNNIECISITDHNTVDAYNYIPKRDDIKIISGVEVDVEHTPSIQCLCYGFNQRNPQLISALKSMQLSRMYSRVLLIRKLLEMNMIADKEVEYVCKLNDFAHICKFLAKKNPDKSFADIQNEYFQEGKPLFQHIPSLQLKECVDLIHNSGGIVILAHPGRIDYSKIKPVKLFDQLLADGLDGFECYHPDNSSELSDFIKNYCIEKQCVYTGGSDMHGKTSSFRISQNSITPIWS